MISLLSSSSIAYADVVEPGMKDVNLKYQISNINDFPDYIFLLRGTPSPNIQIINSSEFSFYKLSSATIYAIKKTDFNQNIVNGTSEEVEAFFQNNNQLIKSNITLDGSFGNVKISNPLKEATIILEIEELNSTNLEIKKSKIVYTFEDGSKQDEIINNQNVLPEPSREEFNLNDYWWLITGIVVILIIIIIILLRSR
ncbi:MAG: hypothetical protein ACP5C3_01015 [Methanomicrobiales archaeon]